MKTVLRSIPLSALLVLSINSISAPLQQPAFAASLDLDIFELPTVKIALPVSDDDSSIDLIDTRYKNAVERLKQQESSLEEYAKANHFSTEYCFLVDMSIPSGKNRFFVYNMKNDSLEYTCLVAHGFGCNRPGKNQLVFSNIPNSFTTSLGRYKIGNSYKGIYGLAYKLYGLDSTNSNAFERAIVLHSEIHVPDSETYPYIICESAGCPMVSPASLNILSKYIGSSQRPVLMWIYN